MGDARRLPFPDRHFESGNVQFTVAPRRRPIGHAERTGACHWPARRAAVEGSKAPFGTCVSVSRHLVREALPRLDEAALHRFGASRVYAPGTSRFASEIENCGREGVSQGPIPHRDRAQEFLDSDAVLCLCRCLLLLLGFRLRFEFHFLFFSKLNFLAADLFALPFAMNPRVKALGKFECPNLLANHPVRRL